MRKTSMLYLVLILVLAGVFAWHRTRAKVPTPLAAGPAAKVEIGSTIENLQLTDLSGKQVSLYDYKGHAAVAIIFVSTRCPVSNAYNERMAALAKEYGARGVQFIGINANRNEPSEEVSEHAREKGLSFLIVKDPSNQVADYLGASVTPEVYVLDSNWVLRYHGRIDDSQELSGVRSQDARTALEAMLAGQPVPNPRTKAFGCTIKRV
jgi:peroxiredoxin